MLIPTYPFDFFNHSFVSILFLNLCDMHGGPLVPVAGYWCILLPLLTVFANMSHFLAMEAMSLLLQPCLFLGHQGIDSGGVKVHAILLFDASPRVFLA